MLAEIKHENLKENTLVTVRADEVRRMGSGRSFAFSTLKVLELSDRHGISRVTATTAFLQTFTAFGMKCYVTKALRS